jgi:hypothetical protein
LGEIDKGEGCIKSLNDKDFVEPSSLKSEGFIRPDWPGRPLGRLVL